jgi:hypothetical protein
MRLPSPLLILPLLKLGIHLATAQGYGFFRDEFYYLACASRLDWGYVDQPPLSIAVLAGVRALLGDSVWAVRLAPALLGAASVWLVGGLARSLGGGRFAQALAMTGAIAAGQYLALDHVYSMNAFDIVFWAAVAWVLVALLSGGPDRLWPVLGGVLGLGLLNKISVLWLGFGIAVGLLASERRAWLKTPGPWLAAVIAAAIFAPHLVWQAAHGWPTLEFVQRATSEKMADKAIGDFFVDQILMMNPVNALLWMPGLAALVAAPALKRFRLLAWVYLAVFALLASSGTSRSGYLAPAYTWLFAAGAVFWERRIRTPGVRVMLVAGPALAGLALAPLALPVLAVERYVAYANALGVSPSTEERKQVGPLPQFYADMHGWDDLVRQLASASTLLSAEERGGAAIFTGNYGEAGAIERLGRSLGLPGAISGHNNYWLWGPGAATGEALIVLGGSREGLEARFEEVVRAGTTDCGAYCMPYENGQPGCAGACEATSASSGPSSSTSTDTNERSGTVIAMVMTSHEPRAGFPLTSESKAPGLTKRSWVKMSQMRRSPPSASVVVSGAQIPRNSRRSSKG